MLRCRPWRWLWGILPLALLYLYVLYEPRQQIEADLTGRAQEALREVGLSWAVPSFEGRDAVISGTAASEDEREQAHEIISKLRGVRIVEDRAKLIPLASPFAWTARHKGDKIRLKGHVPSEKDRRAILGIAKASFPDLSIVDEMQLARGVASREAWLGGTSLGVRLLSQLKPSAVVTLTDGVMSIEGDPKNILAYRTLQKSLTENLPAGLKLQSAKISLPLIAPYNWSATLTPEALTFEGFVPNEKVKGSIHNRIGKLLAGRTMSDGTDFARGAPKNWTQAILKILPVFMLLEKGQITASDSNISITGTAEMEQTAQEITKALSNGFASNIAVKHEIFFVKPKEIVLPQVEPYTFGAENSNGIIKLTGFVPSEGARNSVHAGIKSQFPDVRIVDELSLARGGPGEDGWMDAIAFGLAQLRGLKFGTLSLNNTDLSLLGEAESVPSYSSILDAMRTAPTAFSLNFHNVVPPRASPYMWSVKKEAERVILAGDVPDSASKRYLLSVAKKEFPGRELVDQLQLASGAPNDWLEMAHLALRQLARLRDGSIMLKDKDVRFEGYAESKAIAADSSDKLKAGAPEGFDLTIELGAPTTPEPVEQPQPTEPAPEPIDVQQEPAETDPSQQANQDQAAQTATEPEQPAVEITEPQPAPELEDDKPETAAAPEPATEEPAVAAVDPALAAKVEEAKKTSAPVEADVCQELLNSDLSTGTIEFNYDSAKLSEDSKPLLNKLAATAKRCPQANIIIAGHTDADGSDDYNMKLSLARARSVVNYLVLSGLNKKTLEAVGYGESQPVVNNDTDENKAKNRRIEFRIIQ